MLYIQQRNTKEGRKTFTDWYTLREYHPHQGSEAAQELAQLEILEATLRAQGVVKADYVREFRMVYRIS